MTWQADAAQRYGAIGAGLAIGTAARYGLVLNEGRPITWRSLAGDMLLLGIVGLVAVVVSDQLGLRGDTRAFASALAAVSSDRLIKLLRARFEDVAAQRISQMGKVTLAGDLAKVPAGKGMPDAIRVQTVGDEPPLRANLKSAFRGPIGKRPPADMIEQLRQLPDDPPQE